MKYGCGHAVLVKVFANGAMKKNIVKSETPVISVCIPVYNAERFIAATIEAVLQQTWTNYELIVVDDHSADRSLEIILRYSDARLRLVVNEYNLGPEANWNKALTLARGEFIKVLCHDDVLYPACLEKQAAILMAPENAGVALVCCKRDIIDLTGQRLWSRSYPGRAGRRAGRAAVRQIVRNGTNLIGEPSAVLFRTEAARKAGLFCARFPYAIDLQYWCRLLQHGDLYCLRVALCAFRVFRESWSMALFKSQRRHFLQLAQALARDPAYGVTTLDLLLCRISSLIQSALRKCFYFAYGMGGIPNRKRISVV